MDFVAAATGTTALGNVDVPTPGAVQAGHVAIAVQSQDGAAGTALGAPEGWTPVGTLNTNPVSGCWIRRYSAAPPATERFTTTSGNSGRCTIFYFSGGDATTVQDAPATQATGVTTATMAAINTVTNNALVVAVGAERYGSVGANITLAGTGTYNEHAQYNTDTGAGSAATAGASKTQATAGTTGTATATTSDTGNTMSGWLLALRPAAGDMTPPTYTWATNAAGTQIIGTASEALDGAKVPPASAFVPTVNGVDRTVTNVAVSATGGPSGVGLVTLTISGSPIPAGATVVLDYTAPA